MRLTVATFNIHNIADRYEQRQRLLADAYLALNADIAGLQEVHLQDPRQDDFLSAQQPDDHLRSFATRMPEKPYGLAIITSRTDLLVHEQLTLTSGRVAQRILIAIPGQRMLWFVNTHLQSGAENTAERLQQTTRLLQWLNEAPAADATIITGDFNATPDEPAYAALQAAGYRSAFAEANGAEPPVTFTPLPKPTGQSRPPCCTDYVWLHGDVRAVTARLAANQPSPADPSLLPSDHAAILAEVEFIDR